MTLRHDRKSSNCAYACVQIFVVADMNDFYSDLEIQKRGKLEGNMITSYHARNAHTPEQKILDQIDP